MSWVWNWSFVCLLFGVKKRVVGGARFSDFLPLHVIREVSDEVLVR
jgi:hypothetical protein